MGIFTGLRVREAFDQVAANMPAPDVAASNADMSPAAA